MWLGNFGMWLAYIDPVCIVVAQCKEHVDFIRFEVQTTPYLKYGRGNLLVFAALVAVLNGMNANAWIGLITGIVFH